jgi:phospholipase C
VTPVDHVFVLMLENRSFDHFFGLSGRPSVPKPTDPEFSPGATDRASYDPPHEYADVQTQISGGTMAGFDKTAKLAFEPSQIPVISQLADEFVLFDNWFASVPGPTWPNRFFVHAASSGGLATSPTQFQEGGAVISPATPFKFQNGSIYDRLDSQQKKWRVYHGDVHPQVLAMPGLGEKYLTSAENFCPTYPSNPHFSDFATDVNSASYGPAYTFIEPDYALQIFSQFRNGDSQHPLGLVSAGEKLIKYVYESLRASPIWSKCVLLVLWDEHGGFYDHVPPPANVAPPGDTPYNKPTDGHDPGFAFDRLGVRVPALLISPLAPRGKLGSELFPGATFDHSSVIKSVFENFGLGAPLTGRDAAAPSWNACLDANARADVGDGPAVLSAPAKPKAAELAQKAMPAVTVPKDVDGFLAGMSLISMDLDREISNQTGKAPIANITTQSPASYDAARRASLADPNFRLQLVQYINEVSVHAQVHRMKEKMASN